MIHAEGPARLKRSSRARGKRRIPLRCRRLKHHDWDCRNSRKCAGDHRCRLCGAGPVA